MKRGRFERPAPAKKRPARRRKLNKFFLVTLSLVLLLGIAGGATIAYMVAEGGTVENSFTPAQVACSVDENRMVTNDGNIDAFIRTAVIINWMDAAGNIRGIAPVEGRDFNLILGAGWEKVGDYYYYNAKVAPKGKTEVVVTVNGLTEAPDGFALTIEVLAEAIQAEGMGASSAKAAWAMLMPNPGNNG